MEKKDLKPAAVFHYFEEICQVPRPSKKEEKIVAYLKEFGKKHNLETKVDEVGNVLIKKPASRGMENCKTVVLQSHVDMVCEKNNNVSHDFLTDPIETIIDGEWMKANGTTLGADNGIGVATELAILADDTLEHGPIECLFTIDEETGLTGAFALKEGFMNGDILLNLDSEDEGELFIGCAGGIDSVAEFNYYEADMPDGYFFCKIEVKGLKGGHSGGDIHLGRANANKILNRFLTLAFNKYDLYLCEIDGGNLRNAIPREAHAIIAIPEANKHDLRTDLNVFTAEVQAEYAVTDPDMELILSSEPARAKAIDADTTQRLLQTLYAVPHGVYAMSQDIPGLVETSTNLASIKMKPGNIIRIETSQRSSTASSKQDIANMVRTVFEMGGAVVTFGDGYPGWKPNTHSEILEIATASYKRLFGVDAQVKAIHAGLECGLFLDKYPSLDMISFGPTLQGVHSPDERMLIPTVEKFWLHLTDILKHIPEKK
ncbi:aminoacyl-histidine dipeptidase [Mediterranea massiliensis]|uniref:aminoacyl-histidine dipeptidase n=1 Tax=Mediterranea massiliensis TaxID=1841865 RepID=UPI0025A3D3C3|nr:aminoacyl-histidine dipeptidase [Mediterranea massiliensis]MDM8338644.1 aminoacyl-histidine dipeptidase [Mediterranea massiliensis]